VSDERTPQNRRETFPEGPRNPGGRPKELRDVIELARSHTTDAIKTVVAAMNCAPWGARLGAAGGHLHPLIRVTRRYREGRNGSGPMRSRCSGVRGWRMAALIGSSVKRTF
jgi:hypothetical protein